MFAHREARLRRARCAWCLALSKLMIRIRYRPSTSATRSEAAGIDDAPDGVVKRAGRRCGDFAS
jgi:hypothetical protein